VPQSFLARILNLLRRALGTAQVLEAQRLLEERNERRHHRQTQMLLALGNAVTCSTAAREQLEALPAYQRSAQIIGLLTPMDVEGGQFARVGKPNDGGYLMLDGFGSDSVDAAFSFGVGHDASWETAIADRGIDVYMFDHTIDRSPVSHAKCHHIRSGVTGTRQDAGRRALVELVAECGHAASRRLIMKMDVEGAEWDVFDHASSAVIDQFSQLVIEFHRLTAATHDERPLARMVRVLEKLNHTHQCVHVHANTNVPRPPVWMGSLVLPDALEATYVRRADFAGRLRMSTRQFPTALDQPSTASGPALYLGSFRIE
jgi:hypothetical protein